MEVVEFLALGARYRAALAALEPRLLTGADALALHRDLARTNNVRSLAAARLAARVEDTYAYRDAGYSDAADCVARTTGSSLPEANQLLAAAHGLDACPATEEAWSRGDVSAAQAAEIVKTERQAPGSERELLTATKTESLSKLRERGRKLRLEARDPGSLGKLRRKATFHRSWTDDLGMVRGSYALTPEVGVPFLHRCQVEADRIFRAAQRDGRRDDQEVYAGEAFAKVVTDGGKSHATKADVVVVIDYRTLFHQELRPDSICHLLSPFGPIPTGPAAARDLLGRNAFLKAVVHDGVQVTNVKHFGRHQRAEIRTAVGLGPPPEFAGRECPCGCGRRLGLEDDHVDPVAHGGPTSADNLQPRCAPSHMRKTEADRAAGLLDGRAPPHEALG